MNSPAHDDTQKSPFQAVACPLLTFIASSIFLFVVNLFTQPYEDSVGLFIPEKLYYLDIVWYLDDIIGPALFLTAGITILRRIRFNFNYWPIVALGLACVAFALGDSVDAHWVFPKSIDAVDDTVSFSSWMSKVTVVMIFAILIVLAYDAYDRTAQKLMLIGFFLLFIDQIQMSINFDFAGYAFHVFEEALEVITAMIFCFGFACRRIYPERLNASRNT